MSTTTTNRRSIEREIEQLQRAQLGERSTSDPSWRVRQLRIEALRQQLSESTLRTYFIDTNAGPAFNVRAKSPAAVKRYMQRMIPLLDRRGYSCEWRRSNGWHVIDVKNSRDRVVHSAAFKHVTAADGHFFQTHARIV